ncbi:MAG: hypothetical protein V4772_17680 [Pseudomonadota bacterium]
MRQLAVQLSSSIRTVLGLLVCCIASLANAESWTVKTIETRSMADGQSARVAIAVPVQSASAAVSVRHVMVYVQSGASPQLKVASGAVELGLTGPWVRSISQLQAQGVTVIYLDAASDAAGRSLAARPAREVRQDINAVGKQAQQLFPDAQIHLAAFGGSPVLLDLASDLQGFKRIVLASSSFTNKRSTDWTGLPQAVLVMHSPGSQCDGSPFLEAKALATRHRFTLIQVGYEQQETSDNCGRNSQHVFQKQEANFSKAVADWLDGKTGDSVIGHPAAQVAWREEVITYQTRGVFGGNQLEATLLLPEAGRFGPGPYPVMLWSHGDVDLDHPAMRYKSRIREMVAMREFLQLGLAVLIPARRGVAMSQGTYPQGFSTRDGDASYKARVHAEDILPALAWLKTRADLDAGKVVLAGQSAGGYSTMYLASQSIAGVVGAIDFAGGRTDLNPTTGLGHLNQMMVDGFAEFGKNTRIPTLWVFAENDSRYSANTIRAAFDAFKAAGGKAQLLLSPPLLDGDGHFIYTRPALWRTALREYLGGIGGVLASPRTPSLPNNDPP